jgi:putative hemolysin
MKHLSKPVAVLILVSFLAAACGPVTTPEPESAGMPNPASENCAEKGGTLSIEKRGDGGEYGVCVFEDNMQCEEWAMMRGECPVGGVKVTGFVTDAARYCGISGGDYVVTGESGTDKEEGTCTLPDGTKCDVWDYYNGKCP